MKSFFAFNENFWIIVDIMKDWTKKERKNYIKSLGLDFNSLLILDYATSFNEGLTHKFKNFDNNLV